MVIFPTENEIPESIRKLTPIHQRCFLAGGELVEWNGATQEVHSPVCIRQEDGTHQPYVLGSQPVMDKDATLLALQAAKAAWNNGRGTWATMPVKHRIEAIATFARKMKEQREQVVTLLMWEIGKSLTDSQKEFDRTIDYIQDTIESLKNLDRDSSRIQNQGGIYAQIRRGPLGVVLCMGPYNYPLNETFCTLIPALIMGNAVIFKPAKYGVLLHYPLLELFRTIFPPGVINIIYGHGPDTAGALMESGGIDVLAFIGSSRVANILKKVHPQPNRLRCALGLEAKNPAIIMPDADLANAVNEVIAGALSYNGQRCTALKIVFVHNTIKNIFVEAYCAKLDTLVAGMPWEKEVILTPLPEKGKTEYLKELVDDAISKGATLANKNGASITHTYMHPAVLIDVNSTMRIYHEEQFGPIVPIIGFDEVQTCIDYIVNSKYGQQASLFASDSSNISDLIDPLVNQVCRLNINAQCQRGPDVYPFNGRKDSAEGTLSVSDALRVFSIRTMVAAKASDTNKRILSEIIENRDSNFLNTDFIL